jgi:hypothetical protein
MTPATSACRSRPPACVIPAHAASARQALAKPASRSGIRVRQSAPGGEASADGPWLPPSMGVFIAAAVNATDNPSTWSIRPPRLVSVHGVGAANCSSCTPSTRPLSTRAGRDKSSISLLEWVCRHQYDVSGAEKSPPTRRSFSVRSRLSAWQRQPRWRPTSDGSALSRPRRGVRGTSRFRQLSNEAGDGVCRSGDC